MRILLVEDDVKIASFILKGLKSAGFAVDHAPDGEEGLALALGAAYDAAIVDIMLPKRDGLSLVTEFRRRKGSSLPIIILSAKRSVDDRIKGLQGGSDDYLVKPFAFAELLARVQALIRRASGASEPTSLMVGELFMDLLTREVRRGKKKIDLPHLDFALLEYLMRNAGYVFETLTLPDRSHQVRVVCGFIGNGFILQFGKSLEANEAFLAILQNVFAPIMVIVTLAAALTGWFMAKSALSGVEEVTHTALQISKGAFERRVAIKTRGFEIEQLATAFNHMLDQIHTLFKEMKEINNHIAHDLRSPLARMRGAAEMALTTVTTMEENKAIAAGMIEDCDHLMGMINTMLDIAEAESGVVELKLCEVDMAQVIRNACDLFMPVAENNSVRIITEPADGCFIFADPRMLQRMVGNLLDNALKYTPPEGTVTILVSAEKERVIITVSDTGVGISEKDLPHIFDKFYRCDTSRTLHGSGLGLSLVKAIIANHRGNITAVSRSGGGSVFTVTLPRSPASC